MCMSLLILFIWAKSSCEAREASDDYKMKKNPAHIGIRPHYLLLTNRTHYPTVS